LGIIEPSFSSQVRNLVVRYDFLVEEDTETDRSGHVSSFTRSSRRASTGIIREDLRSERTTMPSHGHSSSETPLGLFIGGAYVPAVRGGVSRLTDPSTGRPTTQVSWATPEDVDVAVARARQAQGPWSDLAPAKRGQILYRVAQALRSEAASLARLETSICGKPLRQSLDDVETAARYFEFYAGLADKFAGETISLGSGLLSYVRREPYGVIGEILPWNSPINQAARGIAPALMAGNVVVAKPAPTTPSTTLELARLAHDAGLPAHVLNVVTGASEVGQAIVEHPLVDKVSFTGSVTTGRAIAHSAAERLIPTSLELGGKSADIIFADADLDVAVPSSFKAFTANCGQICSAGTRLLVQRSIRDEVVARLSKLLDDVSIGVGIEDPDIGPLATREQLTIVEGYLELARQEGALVVSSGASFPSNDGFFIRPTLLLDVSNSMRVAQEEIFGPVLSVITFDDDEEAIAIANDSPFGLAAGIWTQGLSRAHSVAARLEAGQVFVNEYFAGGVETPFGGYKQSGYGRVKGVEAALHYTHTKTVIIRL
jgi:aldehyde dehydrogenase (NAD+)